MIKIIIDVCIGSNIELQVKTRLKEIDVKFVRDIDAKMSDANILTIANAEDRLVITSDKDFGELVYKQQLPHKGILLLRYEELLPEERIAILTSIIVSHHQKLINRFSVYQKGKLRIHS